jgi:hypothetical protein
MFVLLLLALPAVVQAQPTPSAVPGLPPNFEDLLPEADVERFEVNVFGSQQVRSEFAYDSAPSVPCALSGSGSLDEFWHYRRPNVVISFHKIGRNLVVLQRAGRRLGDAALAVAGGLTREAAGFAETRTPIDCNSFPLSGPACTEYKVHSDLSLGWKAGKLTLEESSRAGKAKNPALACGMTSVWNFDVLGTRFPSLYEQRARLSIGQIFNTKRNFDLELNAGFLEPADDLPAGYSSLHETLQGTTTITLKRL